MATKKKSKKKEFEAQKATEKEINAFERNYADDPEVCRDFLEYVSGDIQNARNNRLTLEDKWISYVRLWSCELDDQGYQGRSNVFVPELHHQIEMGVEKDLLTAFPSADVVNAVPINGTPAADAKTIEAAVQYELMEKAQLFLKHEEFCRQRRSLGTSIYKASFRKEMKQVFWRDKDGNPMVQTIPHYHGVDWQVVDLFHWYIYPEMSTLETCKLTFEDQFMTKRDMEKSELYKNVKMIDDLPTTSIDPNHQWVDVERLNMVDLATALKGRPDSVFLTEVWCDFKLKGEWVPVVATLANNGVVVRLTRNPYWFQRHPYLADTHTGRMGKIFYGFAQSDKNHGQQYLMNDLMNHSMDSLTYALNPITIIDPALAGDVNSMKVHPGAKWLGSPEGIKPYIFPDVSQAGLRGMQEVRGQIAQFSDNSPGVAPQLEGKARSATQASIIQTNVSAGRQVRGKKEEYSVFNQMFKMTQVLMVQYNETDWTVKYQGPEAAQWITKVIKPNDLIGEVDFVFKGASAQEKTAVRSQQLLAFFKEATAVAAMQPGEVDLATLFKRIAKEAFDIDDIDEIFKSLREKKTVDPELENIALYDGEDVPIHNGDDDDFHIMVVNKVVEDKDASEEAKLAAIRHREKHTAQKEAKKRVLELKSKMEAMKALGGGEQGGPGTPNGVAPGMPQKPASPLEGNRRQVGSGMSPATGAKGMNPSL